MNLEERIVIEDRLDHLAWAMNFIKTYELKQKKRKRRLK